MQYYVRGDASPHKYWTEHYASTWHTYPMKNKIQKRAGSLDREQAI